MTFLLQFVAPDTPMGNNRRLWAEFDENGVLLNVYEEGYKGYNAVPFELKQKALRCHSVKLGAQAYHSLVKQGNHIQSLKN
tara:strand:- start:2145 stop:2387 length:243 start_codon:yes stop_codon:yes gene_type:complete